MYVISYGSFLFQDLDKAKSSCEKNIICFKSSRIIRRHITFWFPRIRIFHSKSNFKISVSGSKKDFLHFPERNVRARSSHIESFIKRTKRNVWWKSVCTKSNIEIGKLFWSEASYFLRIQMKNRCNLNVKRQCDKDRKKSIRRVLRDEDNIQRKDAILMEQSWMKQHAVSLHWTTDDKITKKKSQKKKILMVN